MITEYDNGVLTLVVEDTGTGMTEEEQKQAFGAFERLSNAAAKEGFGILLNHDGNNVDGLEQYRETCLGYDFLCNLRSGRNVSAAYA